MAISIKCISASSSRARKVRIGFDGSANPFVGKAGNIVQFPRSPGLNSFVAALWKAVAKVASIGRKKRTTAANPQTR